MPLGLSIGLGIDNQWKTGLVLDSDAAALIARFSSQPNPARQALINTTIIAIKAAGVWSKLDALYLIAAHDAQAGQRNWKADTFNLTPNGGLTFTADRDYVGNGVDGYLDTGLNPTLVAGQYVLNSASAGIFNRTAAALSSNSMADLGVPSGGLVRVASRVTGDISVARCNRASSATVASTDGVGMFHVSRVGAAGFKLYKNGAETLDVPSAPSVGVPNDTIVLLRDATFYANHGLAAAFVGAGLTAGESLAFYNATLTYLQGVGAA